MSINEYMAPEQFDQSALNIWNLVTDYLYGTSARRDNEGKGGRR